MSLIYKLYDEFDCYIGSTTSTLKERLSRHISHRNCKSVIILDRKKFTMELIEEVETNDRFKREQYWIDELSTLSQNKCYFESEEERIKNYKEKKKDFRENNKEKIADYGEEYRKLNKKSIAEYQKEYNETNSDKLNEKFICECGSKYTYKHKSRHLKTLKHLAYIDAEGQKSNQS